MRIEGITIVPKWQWSKEYLRLVREDLRPPRRTSHDYEKSAEKYARWLAQRDGIDLTPPGDSVVRAESVWDWRIIGKRSVKWAIHYVRFEVGYWESIGWSRREWRAEATLATIEIPNFDAWGEAEPSVNTSTGEN
jgi:hypothetical protein